MQETGTKGIQDLAWLVGKDDPVDKLYMHISESILEYETHKIKKHLETDNPIPAKRPDLVLINKKKTIWSTSGFYCPSGQ